MDRPSEEFRLPTAVSVGIAVVAGAVGILLGRGALHTAAQGAGGFEGYGWLLQLLVAGGALAVAAGALYFAENRLVYWLGVAAIIILFTL